MKISDAFNEYVRYLFAGRRADAREVMMRAHDRGIHASKLLKYVIWPAMEQVDKLYRADYISRIQEHMATRINRMIADQLQAYLARKPKSGRRMVVTCGDGEIEELGAQIAADLFEAEGWSLWFLGSGVPNDEVLQLVGKVKPDILCIYGAKPAAVPNIRKLIELICAVGANEDMQVLIIGGVFNRAEGLADEVKADLFAWNAEEAMKLVEEHPVRIPKPDLPEPGRRRKRKRKPSQTAAIRKARIALGV
jgi:methanogenic corrinoid protein MtbC1